MCRQTLTSAGAPAGWTGPPSRGDTSRRSPGPEEQRRRRREGLEFKDATITTSFILAMREITTVATVLTHINRSYQTVSAVSSEKTLINPLNTTCSEPNGTQTT